MPPPSLVRGCEAVFTARPRGPQRTSRTWTDLVMVKDLERLQYHDLVGCGCVAGRGTSCPR
jgi:hypothetical protein